MVANSGGRAGLYYRPEIAFGMPEELRKPNRSLTAEERAEIRRKATEWRQRHIFTPHWLRHTVATRLADSLHTEGGRKVCWDIPRE